MTATTLPDQGGEKTRSVVKSAARCLDLLELFAVNRDGLSLVDVCERLGWPKSSTLGLLRTLRGRDFLIDDPGGGRARYRLGPRVAWLGNAYLAGIDLVWEGQAEVRTVSRCCDETVHLATLHGRDVLYIAKEEGTKSIRMVSAVGRTVPAHGTGVGKLLLSARTDAELAALYPPDEAIPALTAKTITDRAALFAELAQIRACRFATDHGESTVGLCCIAAPVYDAQDQMVAAMSVSVPESRFTPDRTPFLEREILEGASNLSHRLGYRGARVRPSAASWGGEA